MNWFETFQQFHFLRPDWLWTFLLMPIIWWSIRKRATQGSDWSKAISADLLKHLTPNQSVEQQKHSQASVILALSLLVIAIAGPTWQKKSQPVVQINDNVVIVLDLSISMLATDTAPDRLTRAKQKLQDILDLRTEGNTALIVFSGDSHVVTPLTDDTNTISANLPALNPIMMPALGSRADLAIEQAVDLLEQSGSLRGRVFLITDGVAQHQAEKISALLLDKPITLSVLAIGTEAGGPIALPSGGYFKEGNTVVIPKTDLASLRDLASLNKGDMRSIALDDSDLIALDVSGSKLTKKAESEAEDALDKRFDTWEDKGYLLLLLALPFGLYAYRKGIVLVLALVIFPTDDTYAFEWADLWKTPDQRAQELLNSGKPEEAAEVFESIEHKAQAFSQANNDERAAEVLKQVDSARAHYNRGNALMRQQKYEEAIQAYDQALALNSDHENAQFNKKLVEDFLEQQKQQQQEQSSSDQNNSDQNNSDQNNSNKNNAEQNQDKQDSEDQNSQDQNSQQGGTQDQSQQQNADSQEDQQQSQDSQSSSQEASQNQDLQDDSSTDRNQDASEEEQRKQARAELAQDESAEKNESTQSLNAEELTEEEKQSFEQWMRRVPDDPGGLLRRKFEKQARERNRISREEGEPLW